MSYLIRKRSKKGENMKQLKVKYNEARGYWVINARRLGLNDRHGNFATEQEARAEADRLLAQHTLGMVIEHGQGVTGAEAIDKFLAMQQQRWVDGVLSTGHLNDIRRSVSYCANIRIEGKPFAKHDLNKLLRRAVRDEVSSALVRGIKAEGKSKATAEKRIKSFKLFINYCVIKGWADINPLDKVTLGMSSEISNRAPRIQPEAMQRLASIGIDGEKLKWQAAVLLALSSGMRQGELRALQWGCVDYKASGVKIQQAMAHDSNSDIKVPKTKRGFRFIPLPAEVMQKLRELQLQSPYSQADDFVIASSVGTPTMKRQLARLIKRCCERAGIDPILWGDMRHFFASVQLSGLGEDWAEVASLMGHSNSAFTYRQYGHYVKNEAKQDKARSAASAAIFGG